MKTMTRWLVYAKTRLNYKLELTKPLNNSRYYVFTNLKTGKYIYSYIDKTENFEKIHSALIIMATRENF